MVKKNAGAHLSLKHRPFYYRPILLRSGPIDTTITVWGPADAGFGVPVTLAAPDPQSGIVPQDTVRVEIEDMLALPEMPDYWP